VEADGHTILPVLALATLATACHWALRRAGRRLPLAFTRRRIDPHAAHPDQRHQRVADLLLPPLSAAVWTAALWTATRRSPWGSCWSCVA
jgi:hypothetical protein